jgi:hypothetical protein
MSIPYRRPNVQMRPVMRQQSIRPMMARPAMNGARPQLRPNLPARSATVPTRPARPAAAAATVDEDDDEVLVDDDSNEEWRPDNNGAAAAGGLPSFANTWR